VTTAALDEVGASFLRGQGAESAPQAIYSFPGFCCISVNDEVVHGVPGPRRLAAGDLVKLDVTARLDGYIADAAVTVPVGEVTAEHQALCDAAHAAFVKALPHVRPGNRVSDVGRVIDAEVRGRGFAVVREVAGHGVGRTIHEPPDVLNYFNPHQRDRFEDGQVVAIEPIITMSQTRLVEDPDGWTLRTKNGVFAAHYEHTVLVTAAGVELLTRRQRGRRGGRSPGRVDVRRRRLEVHDHARSAWPRRRVRDEQLAAALQPIEQLAVDASRRASTAGSPIFAASSAGRSGTS
jgi:methionyl aminopeptidase